MSVEIDEALPKKAESAAGERTGEREHLEFLEAAIESRSPEAGAKKVKKRRGYAKQAAKREIERGARLRALEHARFALLQGEKKKDVAADLGLSVRTLRFWQERYREDGLRARRRGRPTKRSSGPDRNRVIFAVSFFGPQTGVETLRWLYPEMARGELKDILARCRERYIKEKTITVERLEWREPGTVWSMDHTDPPGTVEGEKIPIFSVGDLASGAQLLWEGTAGARGDLVAGSLEKLFEQYGAPLALKCDNGSAFICEEVRALLKKRGVIQLLSPPYTPRYNGSRESLIRWLTARTENLAWQGESSGNWRGEDLEVASWLTNLLPKRPERGAKSRWEVFANRTEITAEARTQFATSVAEEEQLERKARGLPSEMLLSKETQSQIDRITISRALVAHGLLNVRRRRVSLTLKSIFTAKIS